MTTKTADHDIELDSLRQPQNSNTMRWTDAGIINSVNAAESEFACQYYDGSDYSFNLAGHIEIINYDGQKGVLECKDAGGLERFFFDTYFANFSTGFGSLWLTVSTIHNYNNVYIVFYDTSNVERFYVVWNHQDSAFEYRETGGYTIISGLAEPVVGTLEHYHFAFDGNTCTLTVAGVEYNIPHYLEGGNIGRMRVYTRGHSECPTFSIYLNGVLTQAAGNGYENVPFARNVAGCIGSEGDADEFVPNIDMDSLPNWSDSPAYIYGTNTIITNISGTDFFRCIKSESDGVTNHWAGVQYDHDHSSIDMEFWLYITGPTSYDHRWTVQARNDSEAKLYGLYWFGDTKQFWYPDNQTIDIPGGYADIMDTPVHYRIQLIDNTLFRVWENGILIVDEAPTGSITFNFVRVGAEQSGITYVCGLGIVGINGYKIGDNWNLQGRVLAEIFIEESAFLPKTSIDRYDNIDFDGSIKHHQFPPEIQKDGGLSLGHQLRWLQQNVQESNTFYLQYMDAIRERMIEQRKRLEALE